MALKRSRKPGGDHAAGARARHESVGRGRAGDRRTTRLSGHRCEPTCSHRAPRHPGGRARRRLVAPAHRRPRRVRARARTRRRARRRAENRLQGRRPARRASRDVDAGASRAGARGESRTRTRASSSSCCASRARCCAPSARVLIVEHRLGFVMASAGIDQSNVPRAAKTARSCCPEIPMRRRAACATASRALAASSRHRHQRQLRPRLA